MIKTGKKLPNFSLNDQDNQLHTDKGWLGKYTVLYFYPKDNTPGCTVEACDFTTSRKDFDKLETAIYGVSRDSVKKHQSFVKAHQLNLTLLADIDGALCEALGVLKEKSMFGKKYMGIVRTTFILDEKNIIRHVFENVKVSEHIDAVLAKVKELKGLKP